MDPDDRTRRIPPDHGEAGPPGGEPRMTEREVYGHDDGRLAAIADRLDSLRTAATVIGVLALAALALGVYLIATRDGDDDGRSGASRASVSSLREDVNALDQRIDERATKNAVDDLSSDVSELQDRVESLESDQGDGDAAQATQQLQESVDALQQSLDDLSQRVEDLEQQQQEQQTQTQP